MINLEKVENSILSFIFKIAHKLGLPTRSSCHVCGGYLHIRTSKISPLPDQPICNDCWFVWYESGADNKESLLVIREEYKQQGLFPFSKGR